MLYLQLKYIKHCNIFFCYFISFEDIDELLEQELHLPDVSPIVSNKIRKSEGGINGKFVIAFYAELTKVIFLVIYLRNRKIDILISFYK